MKKYNSHFPCYGQSVAGRVAYYQKMGVAQGIITMLKHHMRNEHMDIKNWKFSIDIGNGKSMECLAVTVVIPTPDDMRELFDYPVFKHDGKYGYIDMIYFDTSELQFHIMFYDKTSEDFRKGDTKVTKNGGWHTVREGLTLEDTCTLFEYIEDRIEDLIILSPEDGDKHNSTGALGIGIQ
jgi:hypothetical protein